MRDPKINHTLCLLSRNSQTNAEYATSNDMKRMMMIVVVGVIMIIKAKHAIKTV